MPRHLLLMLAIIATASCAIASADTLDITPPLRDLPDKSGPVGRRMHYLMLRQFGADLREQLPDLSLPEKFVSPPDGTRYRERDIRPIVSLISAGAIAVRYGDFDTRAVGVSRAEAERILVSLIPVFAAHHVANNPEKKSWWWGDEWQSAFWAGELARGAWVLSDELPPETRRDVALVIAFEADRFVGLPAPSNEFGDTKAEENAWNSQALVLAACMLPNHPNRAAWEDRAREYMVTAFAAPQDLGQDRIVDGKPLNEWLRGANVHRDYTLENHNLFHLDYLATYGLNVENAVAYGLAGLPLPESALFNAANCRAVSELFTLPTGCMMYPMSTDWSLYRNDIVLQAQSPGPLLPDPVGERCLIWALDSLQRADKPGPPQNLFGFNFECTPLHVLSNAWMIRYLHGPGPEPASDDEALRRLSGTRLLPKGRVVVCRSMDGIASFSWFNTGRQFSGLVMPISSAYTTTAGVRSLISTVGGKVDPIRIVRREIGPMSGGFYVGLKLERGSDFRVKERVMMLALPDGRVVYGEWFDPDTAKDAGEIRTGLLYLQNNPFWLQQDKLRVFHPDGVWEGDPATWEMDGDKLPWLNVADRLGIVLRGAGHVSYSDRQLVLNSDEAPVCMTAVFYPNADREATARANGLVRVSTQADGVLHVDLGDTKLVFNPTDQPVDVSMDGRPISLRSLRGAAGMKCSTRR